MSDTNNRVTDTDPGQTPDQSDHAMDAFFDDAGIQRMIVYFATQKQFGLHDTLTHVLVNLLTTQINPRLTRSGMYIFNNNLLIFPYSEMTAHQLKYLEAKIHIVNESMTQLAPLLHHDLQRRYGIRITNHMGGSYSVALQVKEPYYVCKTKVLYALTRAVFQANHDYDISLKHHAYRVLMQRIISTVQVPRDTLLALNEYVQTFIHQPSPDALATPST
jgi:hypothetical protein